MKQINGYSSRPKKYRGSKQARRRATKNVKTKLALIIAALSTSAILGAGKAISTAAEQANKKQSIKQTIMTAEKTDWYLSQIKDKDLKETLTAFEENVKKYEELIAVKEKTADEEMNLMNVAKEINDAYPEIIELRTALLKTEVAEAVNITNPEEIAEINIRCMWYANSQEGPISSPTITLPTGEEFSKKDMDKKLIKEIEDIKNPLREDLKSTKDISSKDLYSSAKEVIKYYNDIDYSEKYNIEKVEKKDITRLNTVKEEDQER